MENKAIGIFGIIVVLTTIVLTCNFYYNKYYPEEERGIVLEDYMSRIEVDKEYYTHVKPYEIEFIINEWSEQSWSYYYSSIWHSIAIYGKFMGKTPQEVASNFYRTVPTSHKFSGREVPVKGLAVIYIKPDHPMHREGLRSFLFCIGTRRNNVILIPWDWVDWNRTQSEDPLQPPDHITEKVRKHNEKARKIQAEMREESRRR